MKKFRFRKIAMMFVFFISMLLLFGFVVMGLWNAILPEIAGVKSISFVQALGLLLMSKILFGGFHGGRGRFGQAPWADKMRNKCASMTPAEKEKFKEEWRERCSRWGMRSPRETPPATEQAP